MAVALWSLGVSVVAVSQSKPVQVSSSRSLKSYCNQPENFYRTNDNKCEGNKDHSSHRLI